MASGLWTEDTRLPRIPVRCRGIRLVLEHGEPSSIYHINGDVELINRELTPLFKNLATSVVKW
jgi:hypothetical protein